MDKQVKARVLLRGNTRARLGARGSGFGESRSQELQDSASCRVSVVRIRELSSIKTNCLAIQYLLSDDDTDKPKTIEKLLFCCIKAINAKRLYLPPVTDSWMPYGVWRMEGRRSTQLFAWLQIVNILKPFQGKSRRYVLLAALAGKFRYIPKIVCNRVVDRLRSMRRARCRYEGNDYSQQNMLGSDFLEKDDDFMADETCEAEEGVAVLAADFEFSGDYEDD